MKPELPCNKADVTRVLFPDVHGKLFVTKEAYLVLTTTAAAAEDYLVEADGSEVPAMVSTALRAYSLDVAASSEMHLTSFMSGALRSFFTVFQTFSPHILVHTFAFNCNDKTEDSFSDVTVDRSRPDTLCIASGRTLLIGEDKIRSLHAAEQDLRKKVKMLPPIYYGELEFILGYVSAGSLFQWVYVGRNGGHDLSLISPCLDLRLFHHRCLFYLSLGYAYHLLCSIADAIPVAPSDRAMFSRDVKRDRTIDFYPDYVRKSVHDFQSYCDCVQTTVDGVRRAYEISAGCASLPQLRSHIVRRSGTYIVEYSPVGYPPALECKQDVRTMARCICEALRVLHTNGLVHRDLRLPNIVQISKDHFVLINLETAAECPNKVPQGFLGLLGWDPDTLEGGVYMTMSDMHQLGQLLSSTRELVNSTNAKAFIHRLLSKNLSAELALKDPWLSDSML